MLLNEKGKEIRQLNSLLSHYQRKTRSLKDILSNMKTQALITDHDEEVLNVRY